VARVHSSDVAYRHNIAQPTACTVPTRLASTTLHDPWRHACTVTNVARLSSSPHHGQRAGHAHTWRSPSCDSNTWMPTRRIVVDGSLWHGGVTPACGRRGDDATQGEGSQRRRLDGGGNGPNVLNSDWLWHRWPTHGDYRGGLVAVSRMRRQPSRRMHSPARRRDLDGRRDGLQ
jgi:hypothetical protein